MFSEYEKNVVADKFNAVLELIENRDLGLKDIFKGCTEEEKVCLQYLYVTMPVSDIATYDASIYLRFVRHALFVRDKMPWGKSIPTDIFLDYVLHYRINNENIEECRSVLFQEICDRISGKSMALAAIEINYWCLEKATYKTTDDRTASPFTIIRNAYGRCGEESVLTVSAMRSAGIPARQCYVPRWSHCDDNHAWVEVWIDGVWKFLGACEPEPVLNKGWFTAASTRAMMVHSRVFSLAIQKGKEEKKYSILKTINNIETYAETVLLTVIVTDGIKPLPGVEIRYEVINYSEFYPIAAETTNQEGKAYLLTGLGDLFIHARKNGVFLNRKIDLRKENRIELDFSRALSKQEGINEIDMVPPEENSDFLENLSAEVLKMHEIRIQQAENIRREYEETFYTSDTAKKFAERFTSDQEIISEYLVKARGNYKEMQNFLSNSYDISIKLKLLGSLTEKDYTDMQEEVLNEHLRYSLACEKDFSEEIFIKYILSPRIDLEYIFKYREFIDNFFSSKQKAGFRDNPRSIYENIEANIKDCSNYDYGNLICSPAGVLKLGMGTKNSKKVLFTAICRTLGIPSGLNPLTKEAQYLQNGQWISIRGYEAGNWDNDATGNGDNAAAGNGDNKATGNGDNATTGNGDNETAGTGSLILIKNPKDKLTYMQHFTVGRLEEGVYNTLDCNTLDWDKNKLKLSVPAGLYRIITTSRQIDGSVLARLYHTELKSGEISEISISQRESQLKEKLKKLPVTNILLSDKKGETIFLRNLVSEGAATILAVIEVGKEPTEHLLNEVYDMKEEYKRSGVPVTFIVNSEAGYDYEPLLRVVDAIPAAKTYLCSTHDFLTALFKDIKMGDHRLPLSMVIDRDMDVRFAFSNYNVGTADLLLQIAEA